jgi:hypothetical protein
MSMVAHSFVHLVGLHVSHLADEAATAIGPEGSLCLMVVQEPHVWGVMRPEPESSEGYAVLRTFVQQGGQVQTDLPPPAHRVKWAEEELPKIGRRILDGCPPGVGIGLFVWFGDKIGKLSSVWLLTGGMSRKDAVLFARDWIGSQPS